MVPVLIGCPPGKRLAFDTTYTLEYNRLKNKQYFDCVHVDPEIPCFFFRDSTCPVCSPPLFTVLYAHPLALLAHLPTHPLLFPSGRSSLLPPLPVVLYCSGHANFFLSWPHPHYPAVFYPFFLIQDLVTGDSSSFQGR